MTATNEAYLLSSVTNIP